MCLIAWPSVSLCHASSALRKGWLYQPSKASMFVNGGFQGRTAAILQVSLMISKFSYCQTAASFFRFSSMNFAIDEVQYLLIRSFSRLRRAIPMAHTWVVVSTQASKNQAAASDSSLHAAKCSADRRGCKKRT